MLAANILKAHFGCHHVLMFGRSLIKWRQHPDMTIAVDWDVKHQLKETNNYQITRATFLILFCQKKAATVEW